MFKKYYLLLVQKDNFLINTAICGSVVDYLLNHRRDRITVIDFWPIRRREFKHYEKAVNKR